MAAENTTTAKLERLVITLNRDERVIEREHASTGEHALRLAVIMLVRQDWLQAGDMLIVRQEANGAPLPPPRVKHS